MFENQIIMPNHTFAIGMINLLQVIKYRFTGFLNFLKFFKCFNNFIHISLYLTLISFDYARLIIDTS